MRPRLVFAVLSLLVALFVLALALRPRASHQPSLAAPAVSASTNASAGISAAVPASASPRALASARGGDDKTSAGLGRPLRMLGLGWESVATAVLANDGAAAGPKSEFKAANVPLIVGAADTTQEIEGALARGGNDDKGADIVVVALPEFAASYERLRALDPVAFLIAGWSRGRELVISKQASLRVPAGDETVTVRATAASPAAFLALFALDYSGVSASRVKLVDEHDARFSALTRAAAPAQIPDRILLTTSEAQRLVPLVMVCQRSLVERHAGALVNLARTWLKLDPRVRADGSDVARRIAELRNAPDPLAVLARLGELERAPLGDSIELLGLSGRPPLTLDTLFKVAFRLWREAKVVTSPAPEQSPIDARVIAALVRSGPAVSASTPVAGAKPALTAKPAGALLVHEQRGAALDEEQLLATLALSAGVFPTAPLRLSVLTRGASDEKAAGALIRRAAERFELAPGRVTAARTPPAPGVTARIEVLALL
jgi:hypothetical protein